MVEELIRLRIENNRGLRWIEYLEFLQEIKKYNSDQLYIIDQKGPIYSIIRPTLELDKTITIPTNWIINLGEEEKLFITYCKERCTMKNNCIKNCSLTKYKELSKLI